MTPNERPTPLTDAEQMLDDGMGKVVCADFARDLERSLAERTEERDKLLEKLRAMASPAVQGVLAKMAAPPMAQAMDDMRKNLEILDRVKSERDDALAKLAKCRTTLEWVAESRSGHASTIARQTLEETK